MATISPSGRGGRCAAAEGAASVPSDRRRSAGSNQRRGTAAGAGDRLGVEAPVLRIVVLGCARRAQRESAHGRIGAVVWQTNGDGEPRPAVGAVDKRIAVSAIGRVEQFSQAVVTDRHVGRHERARRPRRLGSRRSGRSAHPSASTAAVVDAVDPGQRRGFGAKAHLEAIHVFGAALDLHEHAVGVVANVTGQVEIGRQAVHERAKADALDHAGHPDPVSYPALRVRRRDHALNTRFLPRVTAASRCMRPKL